MVTIAFDILDSQNSHHGQILQQRYWTNIGKVLTRITSYNVCYTKLLRIETNLEYLRQLVDSDLVSRGRVLTRSLNEFDYRPRTLDVLSGGTQTSIQDFPGRVGYWDIGA